MTRGEALQALRAAVAVEEYEVAHEIVVRHRLGICPRCEKPREGLYEHHLVMRYVCIRCWSDRVSHWFDTRMWERKLKTYVVTS